jgi:hypothetical protein
VEEEVGTRSGKVTQAAHGQLGRRPRVLEPTLLPRAKGEGVVQRYGCSLPERDNTVSKFSKKIFRTLFPRG